MLVSRRIRAFPVPAGASFETPLRLLLRMRGEGVRSRLWRPLREADGCQRAAPSGRSLSAPAFRVDRGVAREASGSTMCVNARAGAALAHGSFRRTGAAGLLVLPGPEAPLPEPGLRSGAARRRPGPPGAGLRAPAQDRVSLPHLATPRERAPRGAGLHML